MAETSSRIGFAGIAVGSVALMLAIVHFWAGPFAPRPSVERSVAEAAVAIRDATVAALRGEEIEEPKTRSDMNIDKGLEVLAAVLGGIAIILGVVAFATGESYRPAGGSAALGAAAIAFQFAALALGMIVFAVLVSAVISRLDFFD